MRVNHNNVRHVLWDIHCLCICIVIEIVDEVINRWRDYYSLQYHFIKNVTSMKKLNIAYNNGLRRLLNLPKYNSTSEIANVFKSKFSVLLVAFQQLLMLWNH